MTKKIFLILTLFLCTIPNFGQEEVVEDLETITDLALNDSIEKKSKMLPFAIPITEPAIGYGAIIGGLLFVPKEKQNLQKILSLYHPLKNRMYKELDQVEIAEDELDVLELQIDALNAAKSMDIDHAEAILRVELGSKVSKMSSKELKRDLLLFAKMNPSLFLELANDENVQLRNFAIQATENKVILLSDDQRYFKWASNGRKLMEVPFDENPYSAFAAFLKTDEGVEIYKSIEKKIK